MIRRDDTGISALSTDNNLFTGCCANKITERSDFCLKFSWFLIGIGFLFPYNSVVTAIDFFATLYFEAIDFVLGWLLLAPSMVILCLSLKYGYWGSIYQRIIGTFVLEGLLTIIIPLVRNVYVVFISTFILGCLSAVLQGTLFSLMGFLGSDMMSILQTGIGCSGVVVGIIRIITKQFIPGDIRNSTYLYFLLAFIMVIIDTFIYIFILHPAKRVQKAIEEDTKKNESLHALKKTKSKSIMKVNEVTRMLTDNKNYNACNNSKIKGNISMISSSGDSIEQKLNTNPEFMIENNIINEMDIIHNIPLNLMELFGYSWRCQITVFLNYTITLSLFPGVISLMQWDNNNDEWFAVIQIFLFNFFDTIGKNLT
eukprot:275741_1